MTLGRTIPREWLITKMIINKKTLNVMAFNNDTDIAELQWHCRMTLRRVALNSMKIYRMYFGSKFFAVLMNVIMFNVILQLSWCHNLTLSNFDFKRLWAGLSTLLQEKDVLTMKLRKRCLHLKKVGLKRFDISSYNAPHV